jgi:hypothetical protein
MVRFCEDEMVETAKDLARKTSRIIYLHFARAAGILFAEVFVDLERCATRSQLEDDGNVPKFWDNELIFERPDAVSRSGKQPSLILGW